MVKFAIMLCSALWLASPAFACGVMEKADPRVGSVVGTTDHIMLMFTQAIVPTASAVRITDAGGHDVPAGKPLGSAANTALLLKTAATLTPGKYKVSWNVLWLDCGSKTQGDYKFTVKE